MGNQFGQDGRGGSLARKLGLALGLLLLGTLDRASGQVVPGAANTLRDGFETPKVAWRQEQTDATFKLYVHERTKRAAHEGLQSEGFHFEAGIGGGLYYSYPLPRIVVTDDLRVSLYVRSNRAGVQVLGRIVLPNDIDPESRRPSFVFIPSTSFENAQRWQKIELADMLPAIEQQAKVLRASSRRKVSLEGAYLERLVVNLYGGEGETEVYLDELTIAPVTTEVVEAHGRMIRGEKSKLVTNGSGEGASARTVSDRPRTDAEPLEPVGPGTRMKLDRSRLTKDGFPYLFSGVRAPGADPRTLRRVGADLLVIPRGTDEETIRAASAAGLLLMPELGSPSEKQQPTADQILGEAAAFPTGGEVAFWSVGHNLGNSPDPTVRAAALRKVRETALALRKEKPGGTGLSTATVLGMLPEYARIPENLDAIGIPTPTWAAAIEPYEQFQYLDQRRFLTARGNADALIWSTIDVSAPPIYQEQIWGTDPPPAWGIPHVQPEQIRLATYAALASGCRGLCYVGDETLTQASGRMNLIEMMLLNEEIDLLEPILADPDKQIRMLDTYMPDPPPQPPVSLFALNQPITSRVRTVKEFPPHPSIRAAAITTKDRRGTLLLVADYAKYGQFQPPQMAVDEVRLLVPGARDAHAYLITPGGVTTLQESPGEPGGHLIPLKSFGVSAIVLVTTNTELKDQIETAINKVRPFAIEKAIEQAELQLAWVTEIDERIRALDHAQKESAQLLATSEEIIKAARSALEREDYRTAWDEARRAARPLRILMRYHFMAAYDELIKVLNSPELPCGPVIYNPPESPEDLEKRRSYWVKTHKTPFDPSPKPKARLISPVACPPLASFDTLPQAWKWIDDWIPTGKLSANLMPDGDFTDPKVLKKGDWTIENYKLDDVQASVLLKKGAGADKGGPDKEGNAVILDTKPRQGLRLDDLPPFVDHPLAAIRSPDIPVSARQVYRISAMVYVSKQSAPGVGGLIVRDSIGGERLQYRTSNALADDWFEVVLYRKAPVDGTMNVLIGLAGYGFAAVDDVKVEVIADKLSPEELAPLKAQAKARRDKAAADALIDAPGPNLTRPNTTPAAGRAARTSRGSLLR
jgi:hypothetical protein